MLGQGNRLLDGLFQGALFLLVAMGLGFYWLVGTMQVFGDFSTPLALLFFVGFCLTLAAAHIPLFLMIVALFTRGLLQRRLSVSPRFFGVIVLFGAPALFTVLESLVPKLFPWYLGNCFVPVSFMTPLLAYGGPSLLTFLLLQWGSGIALLYYRPTCARAVWGVIVLMVVIPVFGSVLLSDSSPTSQAGASPSREPPWSVALIQPNFSIREKIAFERHPQMMPQLIETYFRLTRQALDTKPRPTLVVWPENALPWVVNADNSWTRTLIRFVEQERVALITGAYAQSFHSPRSLATAAFLLEWVGDGVPLHMEFYMKHHLLAFTEKMPLGWLFPALYRWFPTVGEFYPGRGEQVFELLGPTGHHRRLGISICYEDLHAPYVRRTAALGVDALVNVTNDTWFGNTSEPLQHAILARFRAAETGVPLLRATNSGISEVVLASGKVAAQSFLNQATYVVAKLPQTGERKKEGESALTPTTFYVRWGEWWVVLQIFSLAVLIVVFYLRTRGRS